MTTPEWQAAANRRGILYMAAAMVCLVLNDAIDEAGRAGAAGAADDRRAWGVGGADGAGGGARHRRHRRGWRGWPTAAVLARATSTRWARCCTWWR
jgi:hypothetical protein